MTKKKTTTKAAAAKVDEKEKKVAEKATDVKPEPVNEVNKAEDKPQDSQEASSQQSNTNTPEQKKKAPKEPKSADNKKAKPAKEKDEPVDDEKENKKQFDEQNKLKAIAYNLHRDTTFKKMDKKMSLEDLSDLSKLPAEINYNSEILMSNGQVYTILDGLTAKFDKESVNSFK